MTVTRLLPALFACALSLPLATSLAAQEAAQPSRTTAVYGGWTVDCFTTDPAEGQEAAPVKRCEMQTKVHMQVEGGASRLILQMAMGPDGGDSDYWIVFQTPLNVMLREGVQLLVDIPEGEDAARPEPLLRTSYLYCEPARCLSQGALTGDQMTALSEAETVAVRFVGRQGREFILPLVLDGMGDARAALTQ